MDLRKIDFKPDYNKSTDDIAAEFYIPCMTNSIGYDRITGYFGSTVYIIAWQALKIFVKNGGKIRIICSPYLVEDDKSAIEEGYRSKDFEEYKKELIDELYYLFNDDYLCKPSKILACLIANESVELKIALVGPKASPDIRRLFHDKVGIFKDPLNNLVGFRGSMNETFKGLSSDGNIESIDVFPNWMDQRDKKRIENAVYYFNELWSNNIPGIDINLIPDIAQEIFKKYSSGLKWEELLDEVNAQIDLSNRWSADRKKGGRTPKSHQIQALENWENQGRKGILKHATGSGKTFTALCAIRKSLEKGEIPLILVPSKELLNQWYDELTSTFFDLKIKILLCGDNNSRWKNKNILKDWTSPNIIGNRIVLAIMDTASSDLFINSITNGVHLLFIADEVHRIGSPDHRKVLNINSGPRLALSATPERYGDIEGTEVIFKYFGNILNPIFTIKDAIDAKVLSKYFYFPHEIHLNEEEQLHWNEISTKIGKLIAQNYNSKDSLNIFNDSMISNLLIQRARIVKNAEAKNDLCLKVVKKYFKSGQRWIIYCDNQEQMNRVLHLLINHNYDCYEYHSMMKGDRKETLNYFEVHGGLIVSIKCLDEGVDIPKTTHALILASSKNPREFIQRRGRILRKYPGKSFAYLHDAVVLPVHNEINVPHNLSFLESELARSIEFGSWAENPSSIAKLKSIALTFNIDIDSYKQIGYENAEHEFE